MDSDYQYHVHGDYNSDGQYQEDDDAYDDSDGHYDNTWHDDGEGYPDEECGMFEEDQGQTATTTFFDGASNFVINGGSFSSTSGDCSAEFEWGSEPPRPPPPPSPSRRSFFKGTSNFVISGNRSDAPKGASPIPLRPNAKKRAEGSRTVQESTEMKPPHNHKQSSNRGFPDSRPQRSDNKPMDSGRYQSQKSSSRLSGNYYSNGKDSVPNLQAPRNSPSRRVTTFYEGATNMRQINPSFLSVGGNVYGSLPPTFQPNLLVQGDDSPQDEHFTSDYHGRAYRPYSDGLVQENVSHVIIGGKYYPDGINSVPNSQAPQNPPPRSNTSFYEGTSPPAPIFPEPEIQVMPTPIPSEVGFPNPDHQTSPKDMPAPVLFSQAVPSPASSHFLTKRQGNLKDQESGVIRNRNRLITSKSPRLEQRKTKTTLDTKLRSTTAKLAELTLNGFRKRSSQTADRSVRFNGQTPRVSMPHPRGAAHTSADWRSPSPSHLSRSSDDDDMYVKEPHKPDTQSPLASVSQGQHVLGPQPPQITMPQPATVRDPVLFPKPQQE